MAPRLDRRPLSALALAIASALPLAASAAQAPEGAWYEAYATHLSFRGYTCELSEDILLCLHEVTANIALSKGTVGMTVSTSYFGQGATPPAEASVVVNRMNREGQVVTFYWDADGDLAVRVTYFGDYEQKRFTALMDLWDNDLELVGKHLESLGPYVK